MKIGSIYKTIGVMSGTSLDGLDLAFCTFERTAAGWDFELLESVAVPYSNDFRSTLERAVTCSGEELSLLDVELGMLFGREIDQFISTKKLNPDFISSHGHTIFHQPEKGLTLQIGSPAHIHAVTGLPVVADFRTGDVALGGQGAPLVPMGDRYLFGEYSACLNLGGISNISFEHEGMRSAYDISFCNMVLNHLAQREGLSYDKGGELAASGVILEELFQELVAMQKQRQKNMTSLGFEWVNERIIPLLLNHYRTQDLLCTACHFIGESIAWEIRRFHLSGTLLITGGGAHNAFLIDTLKEKLTDIQISIPKPEIINFKEAIIFGFLGTLRWCNMINCLQSVTGASKDHSSGVIFQS